VRVVECKIEDPLICNIKKDAAKFTMIHAMIQEDLPWPTTTQVRMHLPDIYYKYNHNYQENEVEQYTELQ